jgi:hypothetical protein
MKPQTRPFTVEIKRTRRQLAQPSRPAPPFSDHRLEGELLSKGTPVVPTPDDQGVQEALQFAAQVFGRETTSLIPTGGTDARTPVTPSACGAVEVRKPRVLPDLSAVALEQNPPARVVRRRSSSAKRTRQAALLEDVMAPDAQFDTDRQDPEPLPLVGKSEQLASPPPVATAPSSGAGLHGRPANAKLLRSERWKERRLPRVCWDRRKRS